MIERVTALANALHAALLEVRGGEVHGAFSLDGACSLANSAVHAVLPDATRWRGTFQGRPHEWAHFGNWFIDVTASGPAAVVAEHLDARWQGQAVAWQDEQAWPKDQAAEVAVLVARLLHGAAPQAQDE